MEDDGEAGDVGVACLLAYCSPESVAAEVDVVEDAGVDLGAECSRKRVKRVRKEKGKRERRTGGGEGDGCSPECPGTAAEMATRRTLVLAAWWRGEGVVVGRNGEEGEGFL